MKVTKNVVALSLGKKDDKEGKCRKKTSYYLGRVRKKLLKQRNKYKKNLRVLKRLTNRNELLRKAKKEKKYLKMQG